MSFRIRNIDADDAETIQAADMAYRAHLETFDRSSNRCLWKFFSKDFFHDGWVTAFSVSQDLRTVAISVVAPNLKEDLGDGNSCSYHNVAFTCTFRQVVNLSVEGEGESAFWSGTSDGAEFRYSEINTSPLLPPALVQDSDSVALYSLLIQFESRDSDVWVEMVFSHVDVQADEPLAFAMIELDPHFSMPLG